jgi:hypothetical protein
LDDESVQAQPGQERQEKEDAGHAGAQGTSGDKAELTAVRDGRRFGLRVAAIDILVVRSSTVRRIEKGGI